MLNIADANHRKKSTTTSKTLMLPIIQSLWVGSDLSQVEKLCVKSFLDHGHEFHLYTYGNIGGIPRGAIVKDANEILPESEIFKYRGGSYAGFGNWFRYALLLEKGNFWVDMDVVCIKPFVFDSDIVFGGFVGTGYGVSVLGLPKGHFLAETLENACRNHTDSHPWDNALDKKRKSRGRWLKKEREGIRFGNLGGPDVFTKIIRHFELDNLAKPFMYFYPIDSACWRNSFDNSFAEGINFYENTYGVHLTNEFMRRTPGFDKNAHFDEGSLVEQLKKKHGIESPPNAPRISSVDLMNLTTGVNTTAKKRKTKLKILAVIIALFLICLLI